MENNNEAIGKKAKFFIDKNTSVHISLSNGKFYNGFIKYLGADFVLIEDIRFGEMPAFFIEIIDITPYKEREDIK